MKLTKHTIETIKQFSNVQMSNDSMMVDKGNRIKVMDSLGKFLCYVDIEDSFPKKFGLNDLKKFIATLKMIPDAELDFKENHFTIKGEDIEVNYMYADENYIKEAPEWIGFPPIDNDEYKKSLDYYQSHQVPYYEESIKKYKHELDLYEQVLSESKDSEIEEPKKPVEPEKPKKPTIVDEKEILKFSLTREYIKRLCVAAKLYDLELVCFSTDVKSNDVKMKLVSDNGNFETQDIVTFVVDKTKSEHEFSSLIQIKRIEWLLDSDYEVTLYKKGIARFIGDKIETYIAIENK
ncbi:sliding clamp DNA polymerase accessory protein [Vibrio astriarenae]|nr:sliding clamp DNA polymerase accessory protein [Vibrio sp. C7]